MSSLLYAVAILVVGALNHVQNGPEWWVLFAPVALLCLAMAITEYVDARLEH